MHWLPGTCAALYDQKDIQNIAVDLAHFLNSLRAAPAQGGPEAGQHNFYRGGDLRIYDQELRHCLNQLGSDVDAQRILPVWDQACHSSCTAPPVWLHGDMAAGNLLISGGQLSAVIDFGNMAIGDPACDLTIAWTLFDTPARMQFQDAISIDQDTWARAKGWGLWKAALELCKGDLNQHDIITHLLA